jgi:fumarate hydratase, class II
VVADLQIGSVITTTLAAMTEANDFRIERDSMGDVRVPADAKWGAQTQRAIENFPISGLVVDPALVSALARIKGAAALENARLKRIDKTVAKAISEAASQIADGAYGDQFPIDVFQTGSGTSTNMNMNEVLALLATEILASDSKAAGTKVHPNDHVNASQSSNDVFPSAIHVAAGVLLVSELKPALTHLSKTLKKKSREFRDVVKSGRTHLMDATPVTLGQEFGGYAAAIELGVERIDACLPRVLELPLGGTAVGTGINAPKGFAKGVIRRLGDDTVVPFTEARDHFEAHGARDALVEASGALRTIAISLYKMSNDLRWMSSGPRTGLAEIRIPDLQPGSSIMPGKVNPVVPEAVCQVVTQVIGNDAAVAFGGSAGNFELNVMLPVIARNVLESIHLLSSVSTALADKCIKGIEANEDVCRRFAESSPAIGTSLNPYIGYDKAAEVIKKSVANGTTLKEEVINQKVLSKADAERLLDVMAMTKGGVVQ